jgi:DNA repair protein RadC
MTKYLRKLKIELVPGEYENLVKGQVHGPEQLYTTFRALENSAQEKLIGVYLNDSLEAVAYDVLSLGGSSATAAEPDEVFSRAVVLRTRYVVLIHNHPKGDPHPSPADMEVMSLLIAGARTLKKYMLDFIIVGDGSYWSMFESTASDYSSGSPFA